MEQGFSQNPDGQPPSSEGAINVKSYGAVGDGVTDDTAAFDAALAAVASGGRCIVPKGVYLISSSGIRSHVSSNVHLIGEGREVSVLKAGAMPKKNFLWCEGDDWSLENLGIDMQDYTTAFSGYAAIVAKGNNWRIVHCAVTRIGRVGINICGGRGGTVQGNFVSRTQPWRFNNSSILGVADPSGALPTAMNIANNECRNSEIYFNGNHSTIANNRVSGAGFGSNTCVGVHSDSITVIGNTNSGGRGIDESDTRISGFELWGRNMLVVGNTSYDNDGAGLTIGGDNSIVVGNRSWNNARLTGPVGGSGIVVRAHPVFPNMASGSIFIGNMCYDTRWPNGRMTQAYGYNEVGRGLHSIEQFGNDFGHNRLGAAHYNSTDDRVNTRLAQNRSRVPGFMVERLRALAGNTEIQMPDSARRSLREYLGE